MDGFAEKLQDAVTSYGPNLIAAGIILVLGWWAARLLTRLVRRLLGRANVDDTLVAFLGNLSYIALMALVVISALGKLGVNTTSFAAIIAAAGLAIGFALQGSLANFAAGVMLILFRPFKVGDFLEAAGISGVVEEVLIFQTVLRTGDNKQVIVGNAAVTGGTITNYSAKETRRVDLVFGIGYDDDIKLAKETIERVLHEDSRVFSDPAPTIGVVELGDNSVNFAVRPWVRTEDYWGVYCDLNEGIKLAFDAAHISIPYPQTDVHLNQVA